MVCIPRNLCEKPVAEDEEVTRKLLHLSELRIK